MGLDTERTDPAYLIGRLVAYYETMERAAVPDPAQWCYTARYWPLALQGNPRPALVEGEAASVKWRQGISAEYPDRASALEADRSALVARLDQIPDRLAGEQARFAMVLGYRHQRAHLN